MSATLPEVPHEDVLDRVRRTSAAELIDRGGQRLGAWLERFGLRGLPGPAEARAFKWLADGPATTFAGSADRWLSEFRRSAGPRYCPALHDRERTVSALLANAPAAAEATRLQAERVLMGHFDLLGYEGLHFGRPIDWHFDPVNRVRAPRDHWSTIRYLDPGVAGDHKVIWELNRHQFLVTLGQAYWLSGDERYAEGALQLVDAWIDANPPRIGINWASSLEIAFRALSWLWLLALVRGAGCLTPRRFVRMMDGLALSARHVERFLSTYFSPNTHLTGEALGLFAIGTLCPELRDAARWRARGAEILDREVSRHVLPDGVYFERSTYYHRYTVDIYLHYLVLAQSTGAPVGDGVREAAERLLDHLMHITRPDGTIPLIGDDDGGRLLPLHSQAPQAVRATLGLGAALFRRRDLAFMAQGEAAEVVWLLGEDGAAALSALERTRPSETSRAFVEGGVYTMRDAWHPASSLMVVDAGPHGVLNCGHAHADVLSFDLTVAGVPVFVDPGTLTYTADPAARDHFRSTAVHNALSVDGRSSSEPGGPFAWRTVARGERIWTTTPEADLLDGTHDGFLRLSPPVSCGRTLLHVRGSYWLVADRADSPGPHEIAVTLQCAPGIALGAVGADEVPLLRGTERVATVRTVPQSIVPTVEDGVVSPRYGARQRAPRLRYATERCERFRLATFIIPATAALDVHATGWEGSGTMAVVGQGFQDLVVVGETGSRGDAELTTDATLLWFRTSVTGDRIVAVGAHTLIVGGENLSSLIEGDGTATLMRTGRGWTRTPRRT